MMNRYTILLALLGLAGSVHATTIKIATVAPDGTAWMREMRAGAAAVAKSTDGRVKIKYYPGGVMGDEPTVIRKIKIGQLQGGAFTGGELSGVDKDAQIYSLPFAFKSLDEVDKVRKTIDPLLKKSFEQNGYVVAGISGGGFAYLMSVKDIRNKQDLVSAKVWVPQGDQVAAAGFKAAGVTPIPLPLADVYTSLQTGLIDTAANTPAGAIAFQWHTKIKHLVKLPITYVVGLLVIDKHVFDSLSAPDQAAVKRELSAAFDKLEKINRTDNAQALQALQKQGVQIFTPDAAETKSWEEVGAKATKQLIADQVVSPQMAKALEDAIAAARSGSQ